jgi:Spy/CpxP family protein refolding chaperone
MVQRTLKVLAWTLIVTSVVFAQTTTTPTAPSPPTVADIVAQMVSHYTTLLDLTSAQQTQATTIFTTQVTGSQALQTSMQTAQTALQTAITSNSSSGIAAAATAIGNLTAQQTAIQATGTAAFYAILTSDQQTKFTELGNPVQGGQGGPGGPGGGPGGGGPPPPKQ